MIRRPIEPWPRWPVINPGLHAFTLSAWTKFKVLSAATCSWSCRHPQTFFVTTFFMKNNRWNQWVKHFQLLILIFNCTSLSLNFDVFFLVATWLYRYVRVKTSLKFPNKSSRQIYIIFSVPGWWWVKKKPGYFHLVEHVQDTFAEKHRLKPHTSTFVSDSTSTEKWRC